MVTARATGDVAQPAEAVWKVIGEFGNIRRWASAVTDERVEDDPAGPVRVLTMPNGAVLREQLVAQTDLSFSYRVLSGGRNLDAVGTVAVVSTGVDSSRIELTSDFTPPADVAEDEALEAQTKFLRGNVKAMTRAVEAES
ncbi:MAG TPA: SRPBCC family protein [Mycobacteriales bacterium]|nr:SRPBCC family protein [Mycobacteriales bacterium]